MAAIKRANTKPEIALRSELHRRGLRFRKDYTLMLGPVRVRPDIVFTRAKVAVFVDGCFWHRCPDHGTSPKQNSAFWAEKLDRNVERDAAQDEALRTDGWTVLRIWEHMPLTDAADLVQGTVGPVTRCDTAS